MKIILSAGFGGYVAELIRKAMITRVPTIRPIALKIGDTSTILSISDGVLEDMTKVINNVSAHIFTSQTLDEGTSRNYSASTSSKVITTEVNGAVKMSDVLGSGTFNSSVNKGDAVFITKDISLHTLDTVIMNTLQPISCSIVFRLGYGNYTKEDNAYFLEELGLDINEYQVLNSRHNNLQSVSITEEKVNYKETAYTFNVVSKDDLTAEQIYEYAIDSVKRELDSVRIV